MLAARRMMNQRGARLLVDWRSTGWLYDFDPKPSSNDFSAPGYADGGWSSGQAPFGDDTTGGSPPGTFNTTWATALGGAPDYCWLRRHLGSLGSLNDLTVKVRVDNFAKVFWNGVIIYPGTNDDYLSVSGSPVVIAVPRGALGGGNVLAVRADSTAAPGANDASYIDLQVLGAVGPPSPGPTAYDSAVLADSPLGYWKLDEPSGYAMFFDSSGNWNSLTVHDANGRFTYQQPPLTSYDYSLKAVQVSGSPSYGDITSALGLGTSSWTIECWVKITSTTGNGLVPLYVGNSASDGYGIYVGQAGGGTGSPTVIQGLFGGRRFITPTFTPAANTRYHVALVRGASGVGLFVNGTQQGSWDTGAGPGSPSAVISMAAEAANLSVSVSGGIYFEKAAVYGSALSSSRIAAHYAAA